MVRSRKSGKYRNVGLLILRIGLGIMLIIHGSPKLFGGPEMWTEVGQATQSLGINFTPMFFGFMAAITEFFGGIFLLLGLFFKPTLSMLIVVMIVATATNIAANDGFAAISHSIELAIVFISLLFIGPGKLSLDNRLQSRSHRY
ncbi:MAG: DoxX family protein [Balneolaceae bacterium]|nr:DoxX family protein [Balneolaceae bacterium]